LVGWLAYTAGLVLAAGGVGTLLSFCVIFVPISAAPSVQQLAEVFTWRHSQHTLTIWDQNLCSFSLLRRESCSIALLRLPAYKI
jgi:hypothetical protein